MLEAPPSDTDGGGEKGIDESVTDRQENVFGTTGNATDYFAAGKYREYQRETIDEIEWAYEQGYQNVLLEAATGSGKSHIARALAFQSGSSHILTVQKLLQDQYSRDFPDMFVMKGRGAYTCDLGSEGETCATGPCQLRKVKSSPSCPYREAKVAAILAPVTVHNFDSFYYQNAFGGGYPGRRLLIVDECHNIPNKFSSFLSFTLNSRGGIEVPEASSLKEYDSFVLSAYNAYSDELKGLRQQHDADGLSFEGFRRMQDLGSLTHRMRRYVTERQKTVPAEYVFDYDARSRFGPSVTFRPVNVGEYAAKWLFRYGERVLLMSATILDKDIFCREVGLDPGSTYFIQVPSTFPAENRPILKRYAGKMSYKEIDATLPVIAEIVQDIVDKFPGRKGIVQTHSEKIAGYLKRNLDDPRYTFNKDFDSPQAMLDFHEKKEGSIIIASGLREGLDLRGELSKVQIFCKVPYPSLGDKVVQRKMELDPDWYGWATATMFVQSLGRSVRSKRERAVTYILDSGFVWFFKRYRKFIPKYIQDAFK